MAVSATNGDKQGDHSAFNALQVQVEATCDDDFIVGSTTGWTLSSRNDLSCGRQVLVEVACWCEFRKLGNCTLLWGRCGTWVQFVRQIEHHFVGFFYLGLNQNPSDASG